MSRPDRDVCCRGELLYLPRKVPILEGSITELTVPVVTPAPHRTIATDDTKGVQTIDPCYFVDHSARLDAQDDVRVLLPCAQRGEAPTRNFSFTGEHTGLARAVDEIGDSVLTKHVRPAQRCLAMIAFGKTHFAVI